MNLFHARDDRGAGDGDSNMGFELMEWRRIGVLEWERIGVMEHWSNGVMDWRRIGVVERWKI